MPELPRVHRFPRPSNGAFVNAYLVETDSSLVGATPACVAAGVSHRGFLDTTGPMAFPGAPPFHHEPR